MIGDFFCHENDAVRRKVKQCSRCHEWYRAPAFARDNNQRSRLQSQCRRCKAIWETEPEHAYNRMQAEWLRDEPEVFEGRNGWTLAKYLALWERQDGRCWTCGHGLTTWQARGHHLDRIHNPGGHWPDNCRLVCWPCNREKGALGHHDFAAMIEGLKAQWEPGLIQWDAVRPKSYRRRRLPNMDKWRVEVQLELGLEVSCH